MAVRERWIYPSDGSPKYQVPVDRVPPKPVAPMVNMNLGNQMRQSRQGQVPIEEANRLIADNARHRNDAEAERKAERQKDVAEVFNGMGGGAYA